jgi:hypothetical protein
MLLQHLLLYIPLVRYQSRQQPPLCRYDQLLAARRTEIAAIELDNVPALFLLDIDGLPEPAKGSFGT